ncbi:MAG: STAS domain-containing protein, partial [Bacteroidota bacterium]
THEKEGDKLLHIIIEGDLLGLAEEQEVLEFIKEETGNGFRLCTVDISQIGYMNSTGLSLLIRMLTRFRNFGGDMALVNPSEQVTKLLVITKLHAIFTIAATREEAVTQIQE